LLDVLMLQLLCCFFSLVHMKENREKS
jgi:hypothetical protein